MKKLIILMVFLICILISSCKKEDKSVIEPDFKEYVDRFVAEAALRNVKIDISKLKVAYGDTLKYYCGYGMPSDVVIRSSCWENHTDAQKEILLFHELGHALLNRNHDNSRLPNGDFFTIMNEYNFYTCYSEFTPEKRKYYLDKLFIPSTPQPEWGVERKTPRVIFRDTINAVANSWYYYRNPNSTSKGELSHSAFASPGTCLAIKTETPVDDISHWSYGFHPQGIKQSTKLVLSVKIKLDAVTNNGVFIVLRGDSNSKLSFFSTTQGVKTINGSTDFTEYSVEVPYYISTTDYILIYLIFANQTTGTAYFDDITLTNYE